MKILKILRLIKRIELNELKLIKKYVDKRILKMTSKSSSQILEDAKKLNIFDENEIKEIEKAIKSSEDEVEELKKKIYSIKQDETLMKIYETELRKKLQEEKTDTFIKNNIKHKLTNVEIKHQF